MLSALMDSRSRWFVGSSSTKKFGFCSIKRQNQPRRFTSGQRARRLQRIFAAEKHLAHQPAQLLLISARIELPEPVDGRHALGDGFAMVLSDVADGHFVAPLHLAAINL